MGKLKVVPKLAFKRLFGDESNRALLRNFLSAVLEVDEEKIKDIELVCENVSLENFNKLNFCANINHSIVNLEIHVEDEFCAEKALFYATQLYSKKGVGCYFRSDWKCVIFINIVNCCVFECEEPHSSFSLMERANGREFSDGIWLEVLELPKAKSCSLQGGNADLQAWITFLNAETEEELEILESGNINSYVIKAVKTIREMAKDAEIVQMIEKEKL